MKTKPFWIILLLSFLVCGCAARQHIIGYDIAQGSLPRLDLGRVYILPVEERRPTEERQGVKGKLLNFSSRDTHFNKNVSEALKEILAAELNNAGLSVVGKEEDADYKIAAAIEHFQAIMSPAKITFLPYLGSVSTLWAKDDFTIALSLYIRMSGRDENLLIDKSFDVSEDLKLPTGLLNLARYSRGFNYKLKVLDEALKDVMGQIRAEVVAQVKNSRP